MIEISECKPGTAVWYSPSVGGPRFAGKVEGEPWMLGEHTPVVHLCEMEPAYGEWRKAPRTSVPAAALFALELRQIDPAVACSPIGTAGGRA